MSEVNIDHDLYSRQIYALGQEAMQRIASSAVLISGMGGLGMEIAKNAILAGVKSVTIHDTRNCTMGDLSSCFYLNESSIGKNRALSCLNQLASLNDAASFSMLIESIPAAFSTISVSWSSV